jgi:hypothetical protein
VPLKEIDAPLVLAVLRKIEKRGALETAKRVRQRMSADFVHGFRRVPAAMIPLRE